MSDQLANGRRFRIFNLIDDFSRQCVGQIVDTSISGARLARYLDELGKTRPLPRTLVLDNGPEFTHPRRCSSGPSEPASRLHFIQPGKPTQNAFVESFNGKFREYCLDLHWFGSLTEARCDHRALANPLQPGPASPISGQNASFGVRQEVA